MMQTHALNDEETMTGSLPGAARFLAISAAYLASAPAEVSSSNTNGYTTGANCSVHKVEAEPTGARL